MRFWIGIGMDGCMSMRGEIWVEGIGMGRCVEREMKKAGRRIRWMREG